VRMTIYVQYVVVDIGLKTWSSPQDHPRPLFRGHCTLSRRVVLSNDKILPHKDRLGDKILPDPVVKIQQAHNAVTVSSNC